MGPVEPHHVPVGIRLKYLALKNIAAIAVASEDLDKAISFYVQVWEYSLSCVLDFVLTLSNSGL